MKIRREYSFPQLGIQEPISLTDQHRQAALRELHEETGYGDGKGGQGAEVGDVSSVRVLDPGYGPYLLWTAQPELHGKENNQKGTKECPLIEIIA